MYKRIMSVAKNTLLQLQVLGVVQVPLEIQIEKGELAPSTVKQDEIMPVARIIILHSEKFKHLNGFVHSLPLIPVAPSQDTLPQNTLELLANITGDFANLTGDMFSSEASSYHILALMCYYFIKRLQHTFLGKKYIYYPQYAVIRNRKPGPNPQTDACIACVASEEDDKPRVLYECKTRLAPIPCQLNEKDIIEVLLQGYYCLQKDNVTKLLICLTDLHDWHYMLIESSANKKMVVTGYQHIEGFQAGTQGMPMSFSLSLSQLEKHTNFLIEMER